jgi:hypothetical protein
MPCSTNVIPSCSEASNTALSLTLPVGAATNLAPLLLRRKILSENGKNASELTATPVSFVSHASRSSGVKRAGTVSKFFSKSERSIPDLGTCPLQRRSIALLIFVSIILKKMGN